MGRIGLKDIQRYLNFGTPQLISSHRIYYIRSDALFLGGLGLPPAKLDPSQSGLDVIFKNAAKPSVRLSNPQFWSDVGA